MEYAVPPMKSGPVEVSSTGLHALALLRHSATPARNTADHTALSGSIAHSCKEAAVQDCGLAAAAVAGFCLVSGDSRMSGSQ
jgi:hypothetical protein